MTVEDAYVADILNTPGLNSTVSKDDLIAIGKKICLAIPGSTRPRLVTAMGTSKFGPQVAEVLVASAEKHLCPYAVYADISRAEPSATPVPPADPAASTSAGPLTSFADGTFEVGADIAAGKYKTAGGTDCYWARMKDPSSDNIIANDLGNGPRTVIVRHGEYFKSQQCGTWNRVS